MTTAALTATEQRRLEKLAASAGSTPRAMLKHVLRDGFDYCEYIVQAVNQGLEDARSGKVTSSEDVRRQARETIRRHASQQAA